MRITDFLTWIQVPSTGFGPETMIPPKLLVYRRTHSDVNLQTLQETWRRKKSCGDLFQNGYRVRQGHHGQEKKGSQTGLYYSVWSCLHILSNWGKSLRLSVIREIASSESLMCLWQPYICGVWLYNFSRNFYHWHKSMYACSMGLDLLYKKTMRQLPLCSIIHEGPALCTDTHGLKCSF